MRKKTGSIQDRGTSFRISYYDVNSVRQFESFKTEDEAQRELARRLAEVAAGVPVSSKPNTVLFGELLVDVVNDYTINKYKSLDDLEARIRLHIEPVFGRRKAAQITTSQLNAYIVQRQKEGASTGTINRELEAIRHAFILARDGDKILRMPKVPHLKENNTRAGFFTRAEVDRLCSHLPKPYDSFTMFGFLTGWRYSEIQNLLWRNVDFDVGEIRLDVGTTKSGEGRVLPMCDELEALLESIKPDKSFPAAKVFPGVGDFRKSWLTACHKAGLPCIYSKDGKRPIKAIRLFHDLRRSAAREFMRQGFSEGQIMRMCGWLTRSVFDRYNVVTDTDLREKMEGLNVKHGRSRAASSSNSGDR